MIVNPKISICIPTYNGEKYLRECLDTVLAQSYENIEIVIVDDKSSDGTVALINEYIKRDTRINFYLNGTNLGLVANWNKCIELSKGEWIKFVFQDDYILPDCLEKILNAAANSDSLVACKRTFLVDEAADMSTKRYYKDEVVTFSTLGVPDKPCFIEPERISQMAVDNICMNFIGEPTSIMFKRSLINKVGLFNNNLSQICDLEYCLRIATNYGVTYVPEQLTRFRIHSSSTTSSNLGAKTYILSHIDPIITVRQLLYDEHYSAFRSNITYNNRIKLQRYFAVRVYEAYHTAISKGELSEEMMKFNSIIKIYPEIDTFKNPSLKTKILYRVVKLRRKIRSIFK